MEPTAFAAFAEFLKATGPYGLVAVLGWAFWRVNEKKNRELKDLHSTVVKMAEGRPLPSPRSRRRWSPSERRSTTSDSDNSDPPP